MCFATCCFYPAYTNMLIVSSRCSGIRVVRLHIGAATRKMMKLAHNLSYISRTSSGQTMQVMSALLCTVANVVIGRHHLTRSRVLYVCCVCAGARTLRNHRLRSLRVHPQFLFFFVINAGQLMHIPVLGNRRKRCPNWMGGYHFRYTVSSTRS